MKKINLLITIMVLLMSGYCCAETYQYDIKPVADRVSYEAYLYQCPECGDEFVAKSNRQTYNCPVCGTKLGEGQYRSVSDSICVDSSATEDEINITINDKIAKAIEVIHTPPAPVELTIEDYDRMIAERQRDLDDLIQRRDSLLNK